MLRTGETVYRGSPTFLDFSNMETLDNLPSPRIFASHMTFDFMPKQLKEGKGKVIAIFRNPKDVIASLHTFAKKLDYANSTERKQLTWEDILNFYIEGRIFYGSWFDYIQTWDKVRSEHKGNNIMYLTYKDMIQDLRSHVHKLTLFLGVTFGSDFLDTVTEKCTFRNMAEEATKTFTPSEQWKIVTTSKTLPINRKGMYPRSGLIGYFYRKCLQYIMLYFYRRGEIGDWKNYFTVAQNEHFDKVYQEKMKNSSFDFRFV